MPRHWLDSREDMINGLQREGAHLLKLADKIETIEPIAKKVGAAPQLARITRKTARQHAGAGQFEMAL